MFVDVKEGDAADADLEEAIDVFVGNVTQQFLLERFEAIVNGLNDRFVGFALLDFLVDALLDENALQGARV